LKFCPYAGKVKLLLRISIPNENCLAKLWKKFGVSPDEAIPLMKKASELGIDVVGMTFHVGS